MFSVGRVELVRSEICVVKGIQGVGLGNVVSFSSGACGIVFGFNHDNAEIVMLDSFSQVKKGDLVRVIASRMEINVSEALIGRVIDPLGVPLDGMGVIESAQNSLHSIEAKARPVSQRSIINRPLQTGYLAIDSQIPIGLGQRELLLGEKKSGQKDLAMDIVCNQARLNTDLICVYVAIDAETAAVKRRIERLKKCGGLNRTVVVVGRTAEAASLNYIAPMVGTTIAEWFANKGRNVLIVYDDLTRHAKAYRQMSLLLERPASREAYPGDVFYLHSRLLERCGSFSQAAGGGTITALPIVETQTEDTTDFITTNLMSITDGHVLFKQSLANQGEQPPIDCAFSVSRIGGRAQLPLVRTLSEELKGIMIHYEEVARLMSFGTDLGSESLAIYELGLRAKAVLQQGHDDCYSPIAESILMFLVVSKKAKLWPESQMPELQAQLVNFIKKEPYINILNTSVLNMPYKHAEVVLNECLDDFIKDSNTLKPIEKTKRLVAEIESLDGLLRDDDSKVLG
jgi:F-type H+-transporting ATPase subunit alpha